MGRGFEPRWGHVSTVDGFLLILALGLAALTVAGWLDWRSSRVPRDAVIPPSPPVEDPSGFTVPATLADPALATSTNPVVMVLSEARVLACPEGVGSVREVLAIVEAAIRDRVPLVLVAPALGSEVVELLVVNTTQGILRGGGLLTGAGDCFTIAERLGGHPVTRADLQSGYVPPSAYGHAATVVAGQDSVRFVPANSPPQAL